MDEIEELINEANKETLSSVDPTSKLIEESNREAINSKSNIIGFNTPIGDSKYDEGFLPNMMTDGGEDFQKDLNDYRSKNQSVTNKVLKGIGRVGSKVAMETLKLPGFVLGGIAAGVTEIATGGEAETMDMFVNNAWIKSIEGIEDKINTDILPVYVKKSVADGNLWDNISSIDFWANDGADGLGFMASMFLPGLAISKLGLGGKILSGLGKTERGTAMLGKVDKAAKLLNIEDGAKLIDFGASTVVNTLFEAGEEANGAMKSAELDLKQKVDSGEMTMEEAELERGRIGRDVFLSNVAILMLPNMILNKQLLGVKKTTNQLNNKFKLVDGAITENVKDLSLSEKIWNSKVLSVVGKDMPREAMEELSQSTAEKYWSENKDFDAAKIFTTMLDVAKTTDGQKAMLLGAVFGGLGGAVGAFKSNKQEKERTNSLMEAMEQSISYHEKALNGFIKKDEKGNVMFTKDNKPVMDYGKMAEYAKAQDNIQNINAKLEQAKEQNNQVAYNLIKDRLDTQLVSTFAKAGEDGLALLKERLEQSKDFEQSLREANNSFEENSTKDQAIAEIMDKASKTVQDYEFFQNYGKVLSGFKVDSKNKEFYNNFIQNVSEAYLQTNSQIRQAKNEISKLETKKNLLLADLEIDEREDDYMLITLNSEIEAITEYKEEQKQQRKDILNSKIQKETFNSLLKTHEAQQEAFTKAQEKADNSPTVEQEEEIEKTKVETAKSFEDEEAQEEVIIAAKSQSNDFYNDINTLFTEYDKYGLEKDTESGEVFSSFSEDHVPILKKHIPTLTGSDPIYINITNDNTTEDSYDVTIEYENKTDKIRVAKYNIKEPVTPEPLIVDDNNLTSNEKDYSANDNVNAVDNIVTHEVLSETNDKNLNSVSKKHVKLVVSTDPLMTSESFEDYMQNPINKTGEKVTFDLGYAGTNEMAKEAIELYNSIISNDFNVSDEQKEFLIKHLPIKVNFSEESPSNNNIIHENAPLKKNNPEGDNIILTELENKVISKKINNILETSKTAEEAQERINNIRINGQQLVFRSNDRSFFNEYVSNKINGKDNRTFEEFRKHSNLNYKNDSSQIFTHLFNEDGSGNYKLATKELELRANILKSALVNKSFLSSSSEVKFQFPGQIQQDVLTDGKPAENSLLEVYGINSLSDIEFVYSDKENRYKNVQGEVDSRLGDSKHKGSIFMVIPMANGRSFPLKLNQRRINEVEADVILSLTKALLNPSIKLSYTSKIAKNLDVLNLEEASLTEIKKQASILGKAFTSLTIGDITRGLVFEGNSPKNKFKINGQVLDYGSKSINFQEFEASMTDIKEFLTTSKNRNILTDLLSENSYKKDIVENVLSTDVKLGAPTFQGNTNIFIDPNIENNSQNTRNSQNNSLPLQTKIETLGKIKSKGKNKARGKKMSDLRKGVNKMTKDKDQNSDTIC